MPYRNREVEKVLLNKFGFVEATTREDGHRWLELKLPDLPIIATKFSHKREEIRDGLWGVIAKQLRVRKTYLNGMIDCNNSRYD